MPVALIVIMMADESHRAEGRAFGYNIVQLPVTFLVLSNLDA
jgi:hypothetical protein